MYDQLVVGGIVTEIVSLHVGELELSANVLSPVRPPEPIIAPKSATDS